MGQAADQVEQAIAALTDAPGLELTARSSLYRTAPVGNVDQPDFINAVVRASCRIGCYVLLEALQEIEKRFGRTRDGERFGPRSLDLDLLMYADQTVSSPQLELPHPRMHERLFVLEPLTEIEGDITIPGRGRLSVLRQACLDQRVQRLGDGVCPEGF
jgi:2-amino-4-hydroxy-6-hydroxymethyldihydropteridine diphosphokinase